MPEPTRPFIEIVEPPDTDSRIVAINLPGGRYLPLAGCADDDHARVVAHALTECYRQDSAALLALCGELPRAEVPTIKASTTQPAQPATPDVNLPPHLSRENSDRGLSYLPAIESRVGEQPPEDDGDPGHPGLFAGRAKVYESSSAEGPHVWLNTFQVDHDQIGDTDPAGTEVSLHLTAARAWQLAEQIMTTVAAHYYGDSRPPVDDRHADLVVHDPAERVAGRFATDDRDEIMLAVRVGGDVRQYAAALPVRAPRAHATRAALRELVELNQRAEAALIDDLVAQSSSDRQ